MDFDIMIAKLKEGKNFKTYSPENKEKLLRSLQEHHNDVLTKPETNPDIINFISKEPIAKKQIINAEIDTKDSVIYYNYLKKIRRDLDNNKNIWETTHEWIVNATKDIYNEEFSNKPNSVKSIWME